MKRRTIGRQAISAISRYRWASIAFAGVFEVALVLLGAAIVMIGNGLFFAFALLLATLLVRRSSGQLFELLSLRHVITYVAIVSLLVGAGIWLLVDVGFKGQNFICMALP